MTKRRPSWPEFLRQAVALVCGLILAYLPGMVWAVDKSAQKSAPTKKISTRKQVSKKGAKPPAPARSSEIGTAEIVESQLTGLHGSASYYGQDFHGRRTATGETAEYLDMIRAGVVLVRVAPLKASDRNDYSCHAAFEPDEPEPGPGMPRKSLTPVSPAQLDAMH